MGGVLSYLMSFLSPSTQYDPTPDPTTGLNQRDREIITETWSIISDKKASKENSVEFFMQLFSTYPYLQDYFVPFKGKSLSEIRNSPKLRAHATSVFYVLTSYVENVDDPEILVGLVQKIATSHIRRGITVKEFQNLQAVFLKFVKSYLKSRCTPEVETAWNKLLNAQNSVFQLTMDEMGSKK